MDIKGFENVKFPCVVESNEQRSSSTTNKYDGIYYIKIPRTSAKPVSVINRIAKNEAKKISKNMNTNMCKVNDADKPISAYDHKVNRRSKSNSLLLSMVRHPAERALSHFDLRLRTKEVEATDEAFVHDLETSMSYHPNVELRYLYTSSSSNDKKLVNPQEEEYEGLVKEILEEYNFIGVQERMNESLVALSMILGLDMKEVVYEFSRCSSKEPKKWVTPKMTKYLTSNKWTQRQGGDYLLYDAVNTALDKTIAKLNKDNKQEFDSRLQDFEILLDVWSKVSADISGREGCGGLFTGLTNGKINAWLNKFL